MSDKGSPRIVGVVTSILTDEARQANHVHMIESIRVQEKKLDELLIGVYVNAATPAASGGGCGDKLLELYSSGRHPFIVRRKGSRKPDDIVRKYPSYFYQLQHLVNKNTSLDDSSDWILFTTDDGIWHPRRVAWFREGVQKVHADAGVTCVAFPSKRVIVTTAQGAVVTTPPLETARDVSEAISEGKLEIREWMPSDDSDERFELLPQDLCVRLSMLREFFAKTPEHIIKNGHCDTEFCAYVMSQRGTRSVFLRSGAWTFYARPAGRSYGYLTFTQMIDCRLTFKNAFQIVPYVIRLAEMADCPALTETAKSTLRGVLEQVYEPAERAMLEREYTRATKEKPWL